MTSKHLQTLKYQRLSEPEKIILESFKGLKEYTLKYDLEWIYYKSDKGVFYAYNEKKRWLDYDYDLIYLKIQSYFDDNSHETNDFVQGIVEKYLKLKVVTTYCNSFNFNKKVKKHLKLKVDTTGIKNANVSKTVEKHLKLKT